VDTVAALAVALHTPTLTAAWTAWKLTQQVLDSIKDASG